MIKWIHPPEYRQWRESLSRDSVLGFVPTMGALHRGHASLIERARRECDQVVVSIFVNPTQFNDPEDFASYPTPAESDWNICRDHGVDGVFMPQRNDLYSDDYRYRVTENQESHILEGEHRPGHFDGVLTVVLKLFNIIRPHRAYFGEKDWQQFKLISGMVEAFCLPIQIVGCETIREPDGLALSSRNVRLSPDAREHAAQFPRILQTSPDPETASKQLRDAGFSVEYVQDHDGRRLAAVNLNAVRLIDNLPLVNTGQAPHSPEPSRETAL